MSEQYTDGKIAGWPCNASIIGDKATGFDLQTAPYADEMGASCSHEQSLLIEACDGSFATAAEARVFARKAGFQPDTRWGEMTRFEDEDCFMGFDCSKAPDGKYCPDDETCCKHKKGSK